MAFMASRQEASAGFVQHILCTWGSSNTDESSDSYSPSPVRMIYQITQTEDLEKAVISKSEVGAEATNGNDSWPNVLTRKNFDKATLDIVNTSNATKTKYTPYDLYGFSSLKWSGYQGEWNWIKVYYCGASGSGDDEKAPEDQKLNLYYPNRNRPLDQYADRFSTSDPRVQLKAVNVMETYGNNMTLNIANFLFSITKTIVALNNTFIELSFSNVAKDMGLDTVASDIMSNLLNGLFKSLAVMMIGLTGAYMVWKGLLKRQFMEALKDLARVLVCFFLGFLMMAMPTTFSNLPNDVGVGLQYIVMSAMTNTIQGSSSEICSTTVTAATVKKDPNTQIVKNGKINTAGIQKWMGDLSSATGRTLSCQYWRIFAVIPWSIGQYGTDISNLYADGYVESGGKEINPNGVQGDWVGSAAVPVGDGQVLHNWAIYQISAQSKNHIPSTIADAKTGKIANENKVSYSNVDQLQKSGRIIDNTDGDWWRVVDAVSGYDTVSSDDGSKSSVTGVNEAVSKAQDMVNSGSQGSDPAAFIVKAYGAAGIKIGSSNMSNLTKNLEAAGLHKLSGVDLSSGSGLKPGDVLVSGGTAVMYSGSKSTLGSNGGGSLNGGFTEAWRMGTGGSSSGVAGSRAEDAVAFAGSDEMLRYSKLPGADTTEWWNNWIGGNAGGRIAVAIMSLFALIALIIPLMLGATLIMLACGSVILMAFAPVVLLMGLWAGPGSKISHEFLQMMWSIISKRIAFGMLYVLTLVLTSRIFSGVTGSGGYMKAILLTLFVSYAIYANKDKLVSIFTSAMGAVKNNTLERVGQKMTGLMGGSAKFAGAVAGGAALGAIKREKVYATDSNGEYKRDRWGNRIVTGKTRLGSVDKNGKAVHGTFKQILHGASQGASTGLKTRTKMGLYRTEFGRQLLRTEQDTKAIKNRNSMRARLKASGVTESQIDQKIRDIMGHPCAICEKMYMPTELTQYGQYEVCNQCIEDYGITSKEDVEAVIGV